MTPSEDHVHSIVSKLTYTDALEVTPFLHNLIRQVQADSIEHAGRLVLDWLQHPDHYPGMNAWQLLLLTADKLDHGDRESKYRDAKQMLLDQAALQTDPAIEQATQEAASEPSELGQNLAHNDLPPAA